MSAADETVLVPWSSMGRSAFDFDRVLGKEFARSIIEVHHTGGLASLADTLPDLDADLIPLCPNCHRMAHRVVGRILEVEELKELIRANSK